MNIQIHSTTKIVRINGIPARVWEGISQAGVKLYCFIALIAIDKNETRNEEFENDLCKHETPSVEIDSYPSSIMI